MAPHRLLGVAVLVLCLFAATADKLENCGEPKDIKTLNLDSNKAADSGVTPARAMSASSSGGTNRNTHHAKNPPAAGSARLKPSGNQVAADGPASSQQEQYPPVMPSSGDPTPRLSRDIRGLPITITNGQLNPVMYAPPGVDTSDITAFTFQSDLLCAGAQLAPRIGVCYLSANMLPQGVQTTHSALATALCVLEQAAPDCDHQLSSGLTLSAAGLLTVITNGTQQPGVNQFSSATPLIVDGVFSSSRANTLLSSLINFKSGNIDIRSVVKTTSNGVVTYTGSMFLNLFKGGPLA